MLISSPHPALRVLISSPFLRRHTTQIWVKFAEEVRAAPNFCHFYPIFGKLHWKLTWNSAIWGNFPYFVWVILGSGAYFFPIFQECLFLPPSPGGGAVGQNIYRCPKLSKKWLKRCNELWIICYYLEYEIKNQQLQLIVFRMIQ